MYRQYYYWYLTAEGLEFLRQYLHIPTDGERAIVPATHKKAPVKSRPGLGGGKLEWDHMHDDISYLGLVFGPIVLTSSLSLQLTVKTGTVISPSVSESQVVTSSLVM